MVRIRSLVVAMVAVTMTAAVADATDRLPDLLSESDEARIGAEQHEQILAEFGGAHDDPALATYVTSIGRFLALTSERPHVGFTFTVLNSSVVNAFALPGGYVYVTRGLLALAGDEAELAGVLAHEIGHVAARHGSQRITGSVLAQIGLGLLGMLTDSPELAGIAQLGALAMIQSYSREQEFEADTLGVRYLARAGFDTDAMASFLSKMRALSELDAYEAGRQPDSEDGFNILATHPRTAERVRRAIQEAGVRRVSQPIIAREIYLNKIDGILYGDDPEQGLVKGRQFIHPVLGFQFEAPPDFAMLNGQTQVLGRGPEGAILVFDGAARTDSRPMTEYIRDVWAEEAALTQLERFRVAGREAATATLRTKIDGQTTDIRLVAIAFDSHSIYRFAFLTPPAVTAKYDPLFRETTLSFRGVTAAEAAAVKPRRLVLHRVRPGDTQASIAARMPFERYALQKFQILNGIYPNRVLAPGLVVKTIVE